MKNLIALFAICISSVAMAAVVVPPTAIRTADVTSICTTKTTSIRDVSVKTKKLVYKNAGVPYGDKTMCVLYNKDGTRAPSFEVDHIHALWDGGSNHISNLQLQSYCTYAQLTKGADGQPLYKGLYDARRKDAVETKLHTDICIGKITPLAAAQVLFNWKN